jgi:hypothetical protein
VRKAFSAPTRTPSAVRRARSPRARKPRVPNHRAPRPDPSAPTRPASAKRELRQLHEESKTHTRTIHKIRQVWATAGATSARPVSLFAERTEEPL